MNIDLHPAVLTSLRTRCSVRRRVAIAVVAMVALAACSSGASDEPPAADSTASTVSDGPRTGTAVFGGAEDVPVTFTVPAGWGAEDVFVTKSGADPEFGVAFFDVANIYADGCQWLLVDPPVGPTVDDLVAAYANSPGFVGAARDVTVDGFTGKQLQYTVPDYDEDQCKGAKFGLLQEENHHAGDAPNLWAQTPSQQNDVWILDVDGTRLVIHAGYPPSISPRDRTDLDGIIKSIRIA
jgi:hypothetical protein